MFLHQPQQFSNDTDAYLSGAPIFALHKKGCAIFLRYQINAPVRAAAPCFLNRVAFSPIKFTHIPLKVLPWEIPNVLQAGLVAEQFAPAPTVESGGSGEQAKNKRKDRRDVRNPLRKVFRKRRKDR